MLSCIPVNTVPAEAARTGFTVSVEKCKNVAKCTSTSRQDKKCRKRRRVDAGNDVYVDLYAVGETVCRALSALPNEQGSDQVTRTTDTICRRFMLQKEVYTRRLEREQFFQPKNDYVEKVQKNIGKEDRNTFVNLQIYCAHVLKMSQEAIFLSISYFDRFLSTYAMDQKYLALLSAACLFIASKYQDSHDSQYTISLLLETYEISQKSKKQLIAMETKVLKVLDYGLTQPTIDYFLTEYLLRTGNTDNVTYYLALFLSELFLTDYASLCFFPSTIALVTASISIKTRGGKYEEPAENNLKIRTCHSAVHSCFKKELKNDEEHGTVSSVKQIFMTDGYKNVASIKKLNFDINS